MSLLRRLLAAVAIVPALTCSASACRAGTSTFAGGCFWCMEPPYERLCRASSPRPPATWGNQEKPSYEAVSSGATGHAEVVQIVYDPKKVSYEKLLETFWKNVDPTVRDRQFCDIGNQYRTSVFYHTEEQKRLAEASKGALAKTKPFKEDSSRPSCRPERSGPAEDYHQDFYVKNP